MNGALALTIDLIVLTIGTFASVILAYIGLKIVRAIAEGRLQAEHLVSDKGSNLFSTSKAGQGIGMLALTMGFIFIITHIKFESVGEGTWIYWLFAAYGTIMILPQAWTNFLNQNKPPQLPGSSMVQTDSTVRKQTTEILPASTAEEPK